MSKHLIRKLTLFLLLCAGLIPVATAATVEELLAAFDRNQDLTTANRFLKALYDEGQMDELLQYPAGTAVDTLRREVWCWAADWFFSNQHYDRSEEYGLKALPLFADSTRERSDCLNTLACADMRLGHFLKAADYATRSLNIELFLGDADVISSSMNTLAAIYMAANQSHEAHCESTVVQRCRLKEMFHQNHKRMAERHQKEHNKERNGWFIVHC